MEWNLILPQKGTSVTKDQGKVFFEKGESTKTIQIEVSKQDRDLQLSLHGVRDGTTTFGIQLVYLCIEWISIPNR